MAGPVATMTAGSAGGSPPRREDASTIPSHCQSAPDASVTRKGRGMAKGNDLIQYVDKHGKIPIRWETESQTYKALGKHGNWYYCQVGMSVRDCTEPFHGTWDQVPPDQKPHVRQRMLNWFILDYNDKTTCTILNRDCKSRYNDWKHRLHNDFKTAGGIDKLEQVRRFPSPLLKDKAHWESCIQKFIDPAFQDKSTKNSANRKKHKWSSFHGRTFYAEHREKALKTTQSSDGSNTAVDTIAVKTWGDLHRKGDTWASAEAEAAVRLMEDRIAQATQEAANSSNSSSVHVDQHAIMADVLGRRRGHLTGLGPSLCSNAASLSHSSFQQGPTQAQYDQLTDKVEHMEEVLRRLTDFIRTTNPDASILEPSPSTAAASNDDTVSRPDDDEDRLGDD